ncbi:MAG: hypothetical protein HC945_02340 [Nitrosarchaeum sp.]|nr:hypothetical protein [Nitrosarchaeum sp.]
MGVTTFTPVTATTRVSCSSGSHCLLRNGIDAQVALTSNTHSREVGGLAIERKHSLENAQSI